jgi:sugar-specific transcriptional regulator TrmB
METIELIQKLGLKEKEAKVYITLLQLGKVTAYTVAKASGLIKPTAYAILDKLVKKEFALKIPYAKKNIFFAKTPDQCLQHVLDNLSDVKENLPELMALQKEVSDNVSILYFEGMQGIKEAHERLFNLMKKKDEKEREYVGFFAQPDDDSEELIKYLDEVNKMHQKLKIRRKAITVYNKQNVKKYLNQYFLEKHNVKIKALNEEKYSSNIEITAIFDSIQIFSHKYQQIVVLINPDVARTIRQIFDMVWDLVDDKSKDYLKFDSDKV